MQFKYSLLCGLLLFSLGATAGATPFTAAFQNFERKLSETYRVNNATRVKLDNRYGKITVETWDRSEVKIDVLIRVNARDQEAADDVFKRINVDLTGSNSSVSAVTEIESSRGNAWWNILTGNSNRSSDFKIYYTVRMPARLTLETEARYCDVELPDLDGETYLTVRYGDLVGGRLSNRNQVDIAYGSARLEGFGQLSRLKVRYSEAVVRNAAELRYDGRYSETRIGKATKLDIDAGYEEIEVGEVGQVRLDGSYNELSVDRCDRAFLDGNYSEFTFGRIAKELEVEANYGDLEVEDLVAGFERVYVRTTYMDVDINVAADAGYELQLSTRYGDISTDTESLKPRTVEREGRTEKVSGRKAGTGNGKIDISTSYGDIDLY